MKGIIFNAVEQAVIGLYDEDTWDDLLDAAGLEGDYTSIGTYDDGELLQLVAVGCKATGLDAGALVRALGQSSFKHLAERHPEFLEGPENAADFLVTIDEIIHPEVMKLHPDATPPRFEIEHLATDTLRMTYISDRQLSAMAEGLIHGAADWFGEKAEITVIDAEPARTVFDVHLSPK